MKALQGRRILVTRPAAQAGTLAAMISEQGGQPVLFPLLEIRAATDSTPLQQAIARLDDYRMAIFISPNAVDFSVPRLLAARAWPPKLQVAAIGPGTVARLAEYGITSVIVPRERFDSEALLEHPDFQADRVTGQEILILRGNGGRELLAETLSQRGATIDAVTCYQRTAPTDGRVLVSLLRTNALDALTISSSEGLHNLLALLDTDSIEQLRVTPIFVPHPRIAEIAATLDLRRIIQTAPADAGIIESLCAYPWPYRDGY